MLAKFIGWGLFGKLIMVSKLACQRGKHALISQVTGADCATERWVWNDVWEVVMGYTKKIRPPEMTPGGGLF